MVEAAGTKRLSRGTAGSEELVEAASLLNSKSAMLCVPTLPGEGGVWVRADTH